MTLISLRRALAGVVACLLVAGAGGAVTVEKPTPGRTLDAGGPVRRSVPVGTEPDPVTATTELATTTTTPSAPSIVTTQRSATTQATPPSVSGTDAMTSHQPVTLKSGIYVASADGGPAKRIVAYNLPGGLSFSPDGSELAYVVLDQIWVAPVSGGASRPVSQVNYRVGSPKWSPTGRYLAYIASRTESSTTEVIVLDVTTGAERNLGPINNFWESGLVWRDDDVLAFFDYDSLLIYNPATTAVTDVALRGSGAFTWSPAGDAIAHLVGRDLIIHRFVDRNNFEWDGSYTPIAATDGAHDFYWSGDDIFFINPWTLQAIRPDGSMRRNVVADYAGGLQIAPQRPDELFVAIIPNPNDPPTRHVERMSLDGTNRRVIASPPAGHDLQQFAVSPRGDVVAFTAAGE